MRRKLLLLNNRCFINGVRTITSTSLQLCLLSLALSNKLEWVFGSKATRLSALKLSFNGFFHPEEIASHFLTNQFSFRKEKVSAKTLSIFFLASLSSVKCWLIFIHKMERFKPNRETNIVISGLTLQWGEVVYKIACQRNKKRIGRVNRGLCQHQQSVKTPWHATPKRQEKEVTAKKGRWRTFGSGWAT